MLGALKEKQQIPMLLSFVWPDRGSNPRSTTLEASMTNHYATDVVKLKESLNSNGHQYHQYQRSELSPLILTELSAQKEDSDICRWRSRFWVGTDTKMWRDKSIKWHPKMYDDANSFNMKSVIIKRVILRLNVIDILFSFKVQLFYMMYNAVIIYTSWIYIFNLNECWRRPICPFFYSHVHENIKTILKVYFNRNCNFPPFSSDFGSIFLTMLPF
jgi:hypothetical protein